MQFENDVKTYGTQTPIDIGAITRRFENDVKTYGTQTVLHFVLHSICLRMM